MSTWQKLGTSVAVTVTCLCWSLGHAEQLLFSCLCSKVSICNYVTCDMSHFACQMSHVRHIAHVTCHMSNAYVDPWDMLNNFCSHVYAQKWAFVIMSHVTCRMSQLPHVTCQMLICWSLGHAEIIFFHVYTNIVLFMGENKPVASRKWVWPW